MTALPVIAGYVRSPFAPANKGELVDVRPDELCGLGPAPADACILPCGVVW